MAYFIQVLILRNILFTLTILLSANLSANEGENYLKGLNDKETASLKSEFTSCYNFYYLLIDEFLKNEAIPDSTLDKIAGAQGNFLKAIKAIHVEQAKDQDALISELKQNLETVKPVMATKILQKEQITKCNAVVPQLRMINKI